MPQFDFYTFALQNFYVIFFFLGIYLFILFYYLPQYSEALKMRKKLVKYYGKQNTQSKIELVNLFYSYIFLNKK